MEEKIKAAIGSKININHLQVVNESHLHSGHAGDDGSGETHYKLIIASPDFNGLSRVQRQRLVNNTLSGCFEDGLHAVSMELITV